jgi:predicted metal-dependent hydrolase
MLVDKYYIEVLDKKIAVYYYEEIRSGARVSITAKGVNLRVPARISSTEKEKIKATYTQWAIEKLTEKLEKGPVRQEYFEGSIFKYFGDEWTLNFTSRENEYSLSSKLFKTEKKIIILYPSKYEITKLQKVIGDNLSKIMALYYLEKIESKLQTINASYFQKPLLKVSLRNTSSKWGSCGSNGHISISTRLLFAPEWVVDYVLVHELCHLVHMDHSSRFWKLVGAVYPMYKEAEQHLKKHGSGYNF